MINQEPARAAINQINILNSNQIQQLTVSYQNNALNDKTQRLMMNADLSSQQQKRAGTNLQSPRINKL